jgi:hypothetical protein
MSNRIRRIVRRSPWLLAVPIASVFACSSSPHDPEPVGEADQAIAICPQLIHSCPSGDFLNCTRGTNNCPVCTCTAYGVATFTPAREYGVQPGWARATFNYSVSGATSGAFSASVTCASGSPSSVTVTPSLLSSSLVGVDIRANTEWLAANSLPTPCEVASVTVQATGDAAGSGTFTNTFATDVPLGFRTPSQLAAPVTGTSVSLQPSASTRRYLAYPPLILAIQSASGRIAFAEVEELPGRGTVGLRALASFLSNDRLDRELGGGAEIYPGWGLDVDLLGVTKVTSGTEESNPGHYAYTSPAPGVPSLYYGDPGGPVYPAPPVYGDVTYLASVLDNHGVPRCTNPAGCLDVVYDQTAHTLNAVNGATVEWLEGGPIQAGVLMTPQVVTPAATTASTTAPAVAPLAVSHAPAATVTGPPPVTTTPSPQQQLAASAWNPSPDDTILSGATGTCPLSGAKSSVPLTQCSGSSAAFPCPTSGDPLRVDTLPMASPGSVPNQLSLSSMMPQYAGRSNYFGTCGSHAATQYYELLVNKLGADLATARTITVDGQAVVVPNPLIAYSVAGGTTNLYTSGGTQAGDPDVPPSTASPSGSSNHNLPSWINGYWPAYEQDWYAWTGELSSEDPTLPGPLKLATCASKGYWYSGYCLGQGQPPPGAYWNYNNELATLDQPPFAAMPWSLANTYFDVTTSSISLSDRDQAIQQVIATLTTGLPVLMSLDADSSAVTDSAGNQESLLGSMSWFLPPELGACSAAQIAASFQPSGGHDIDIIGYSIVGSPSTPDIFASYFIIDNNWGKGWGYGGYGTMNFAAFKFLASGLALYNLDCPYTSSLVCAP